MIALTDSAGTLLERIENEQSLPHALRLDLTPTGADFAVGLTEPATDDEVLYFGEAPVLYISAAAAEALGDCTLTTQETPEGPSLAVAPLSD